MIFVAQTKYGSGGIFILCISENNTAKVSRILKRYFKEIPLVGDFVCVCLYLEVFSIVLTSQFHGHYSKYFIVQSYFLEF